MLLVVLLVVLVLPVGVTGVFVASSVVLLVV